MEAQVREVASALSYGPVNRRLFDIFEALYQRASEAAPAVAREYHFLYLVVRCINDGSSRSFSDIADYYAQNGSRFLCFLSDLAVLRLDTTDEKSYERAAAYAEKCHDRPAARVVTNEQTCGVSVIVPTYNRSNVIEESLQSVRAQDFKDFEVIVVNDGGDDETEQVIVALNDPRIRYKKIVHKGLAGALNAGIREANGEYIAYLDDDDVYYPDHLSTLLQEARKRGKAFVYSKSKVIHGYRDSSGGFRPWKEGATHALPYSKATLASRLGISILNVIHERSLVDRIGLFNEELPWSMDWEYWMRMSDVSEPLFVDRWTGEYRKTADNMTISQWYKGFFYMNALLVPYFCSAYGVLSLYESAARLRKQDRAMWIEALARAYISEDELMNTAARTRQLLYDGEFLRGAILNNRFRSSYSASKCLRRVITGGLKRLLRR